MLFHPRRYNLKLENILNKEKNFIYSHIAGISYNKMIIVYRQLFNSKALGDYRALWRILELGTIYASKHCTCFFPKVSSEAIRYNTCELVSRYR